AIIGTRLALDRVDEFAAWQRWWERHCLRAAADGGLFPNLYIRRRRSSIEFSWDSRTTEYAPADFAFSDEAGHALVTPAASRDALWDLLDASTAALADRFSGSERLVALRQTVLGVRDNSRTELRS